MMHRYLWMFLVVFGLHASAQTVFIPDTNLRVWLNVAKPNSVDALGNCDTAAWNAQPPPSLTCSFGFLPNGTTVLLEGIQHLKISNLMLFGDALSTSSYDWPGYPIGIEDLTITNLDAAPLLPLPGSIGMFQCAACGLTSIPAFNGTHMYLQTLDLGGQVQTVPPSLGTLHVVDCNLSQAPALANLTQFKINQNPLADWTNLPGALTHLYANDVGLNYLPPLAPPLVVLWVAGNGLTTLPAMPNTLLDLDLSNNLFTSIPPLPPLLTTLGVKTNPITTLPTLPASLRYLQAAYSTLVTLPTLPAGLTFLDLYETDVVSLPTLSADLEDLNVSYTPITQLPTLPPLLDNLKAIGATSLTCLPALPPAMATLRLSGSGVTCIPNIPPALVPGLGFIGIPPVVCNPGISPCPIVDPLITGTTFVDADLDGVFDVGEAARPNAMVEAQPGDLLAGSDLNGNYVLPANIGSFSVSGVPGLYEPVTGAPYVVTFTGLGQVDSLNHIGYTTIGGIYDLVTTVTGTNVRPGFNTGVWVTVNNVGTEPTTATVQLTFDAALSYVNSSEVPDAVNGNVVDWTTPVLVPGGSWTVWVDLYGPPSLVLGSPVVQQATATPSQPDQTPADNTYVLNDVVVGSFDPNDKKVEPEFLSLADVAAGTRVHYTVRFQNTGTFPAERVLITDTLSTDLYWSGIRIEAASHAHTWYLHNGVLHVLFENINLPDSVSDEPGSHGFVKFSFVASSSLVVGSAVGNIANIYFDYNEPVITNDAIFYVEAGLAVNDADTDGLRVWPNPADDVLFVAMDGVAVSTLSVVDATGREVMTSSAGGARAELNVGALAAGPYVVRCTTISDVRSIRFVKQ